MAYSFERIYDRLGTRPTTTRRILRIDRQSLVCRTEAAVALSRRRGSSDQETIFQLIEPGLDVAAEIVDVAVNVLVELNDRLFVKQLKSFVEQDECRPGLAH